MSIKLRCPNGHSLSVADRFAGKSGLCPACKARVQIPRQPAGRVSEEAILDILGPPSPGRTEDAATRGSEEPHEADGTAPPKKTCYRCQQEISAATHICPFCHTYIASLADF